MNKDISVAGVKSFLSPPGPYKKYRGDGQQFPENIKRDKSPAKVTPRALPA